MESPTLKHGLNDLHSDNEYVLRFPKARWTLWNFDQKDDVIML